MTVSIDITLHAMSRFYERNGNGFDVHDQVFKSKPIGHFVFPGEQVRSTPCGMIAVCRRSAETGKWTVVTFLTEGQFRQKCSAYTHGTKVWQEFPKPKPKRNRLRRRTPAEIEIDTD